MYKHLTQRFSRSFVICILLAIFLLYSLLILSRRSIPSFIQPSGPVMAVDIDRGAGNSTLGFQAILALGPHDVPPRMAWRKDGMKTAAARTGLEIRYPRPPIWTASDIENLQENNRKGELKEGYAQSWLGHLYMLKQATNFTTALILEDDVDWDVAIRTQMVPVADAVKKLTQSPESAEKLNHTTSGDTAPYGMDWDVIWLGHCGSHFGANSISFDDPTLPDHISSWNSAIAPDPHHVRHVHWTTDPVCVYAYAVTGESATKIISKWTHGNTIAFDIWLMDRCREGKLRCLAVSPELFHEHVKAGVHDSIINGKTEDQIIDADKTENIWHSARCNSNTTDDALIECRGLN